MGAAYGSVSLRLLNAMGLSMMIAINIIFQIKRDVSDNPESRKAEVRG